MKKLIMIVSLLSSVSAFATISKAPTFKLDCSKAAGGEVSLTSTQKRFTAKEAATMAYKCFVDKKATTVQQARIQAMQESQASEPGESCGNSDPEFELSTVSSWVSGRPDISTVKGVEIGEMGGTYVFAIRENFNCSDVGTGLFEGVTSSSVTNVNVDESYKFEFNGKKSNQEITVKILVK